MKQLTLMVMTCALITIQGTKAAHAQTEHVDAGFSEPFMSEPLISCDPGIPICNSCLQPDCDGKCHRLCRRLGFYGGGVIDIPLEGVFQSAVDATLDAGTLGADPLFFPAATPVDLMIDEMGFDDVYSAFYGYNANLTIEMDSATKIFVGYREVNGEADELQVGEAIIDPAGVNTTAPIMAQFDDYSEYSIQLGFMTSRQWHSRTELLWGGRGGVAFVDAINGTFSIPNVATLADVPFYEDSTILTFGVNFGLRYNANSYLSLVALTGTEYRTSLDENDSALDPIGLGNLNNGGGFTSLPIYLGFTVKL